MRYTKPLLVVVAVVLVALAQAGCPRQTTISRILADPAEFHDKDVALRGNVTQSFGVLGQGVYEIDDGTGKLWILTEEGVPSKGARVEVAGRVISAGVTFAGRNFATALREKKRRTRT